MLQGLSPVFTKMLLIDGLPRETVVSARYLLAFFLLLPFGVPASNRRPSGEAIRRSDWVVLFLVGALGSGVGALLFTAALEYSAAGVVNSISKTAPIFVAFLGHAILRERVTPGRLMLVGAMVGAHVLFGIGELTFERPEARARLLGDGLALLAGLTRATSEILAKGVLRRFAPSTVTMWRFGSGLAVTGSLAALTGGYRELAYMSMHAWTILVALAAVSTALSMYLYYRGMAGIPVHVAVSLKVLGAVVTAVVSWIVLRETLNLFHVAGMGLLISGGYLLVLRTARETPEEAAPAAVAPPRRPPARGRLRARLTMLVVAFTVATVGVATLLSVRHSHAVMGRQIQLTMGKVAAVLVQLPGVDEPPSRNTLQQYLDRVVRHRIEDELYSVDIVYVALLDGAGSVLAFSVNEELALVDEYGAVYRPTDLQAARRLLAMAERGQLGPGHDIIPVRAELVRPGDDGRPTALVEIGCKRSIANRVLAEVAARNAVLVLILIAVCIALAVAVVRRVTNPLERIAAAMRRLSGGELDMPLLTEGGGEVREMGASLEALRENLRMGSALRRALVSHIADELRGVISVPSVGERTEDTRACVMVVRTPAELWREKATEGSASTQVVEAVVATVLRNDGEIDRCVDGSMVAHWPGSGEEAAVWAVVTALELQAALEALPVSSGAGATIAVEIADTSPALPGGMEQAQQLGRMLDARAVCEATGRAQVLAGPRLIAQIGEHLVVEPGGEGPLWRVRGLADARDPGLLPDAGDV